MNSARIKQPDFRQAREYALERLTNELSPSLLYHSVAHTYDDVVPAVERLASMQGILGEELLLLRTAALYHDIGYIVQRDGHEAISAGIAEAALPEFGYSSEQIAEIVGLIMATKLPQSPHNLIAKLLADADLDSLGRDDFLALSYDLRSELALYGLQTGIEEWLRSQLIFLQLHTYFSDVARALRDTGKQKNIKLLLDMLDAYPTS